MGKHNDDAPRAYSTWMSGNGTDGFHADGHSVRIDPERLDASVTHYRKGLANAGAATLQSTLEGVMGVQASFGQIPHAATAQQELMQFVSSHLDTMKTMGISIEDFVARVQAAANLGYESDPATVAAAKAAQATRATNGRQAN